MEDQPLKTCRGCLKSLPKQEFGRRLACKDGLNTNCKQCAKTRQAKYLERYLSDPKKKQKQLETQAKYFRDHAEHYRQLGRSAFLKLKREMLVAYGPGCKCCGESREMFLTLEHTNRDGSEHRKRVGGGANTYRDLKRRGWPQDGFTVLCMNCNWATRFGGVCPHKQGTTDAANC